MHPHTKPSMLESVKTRTRKPSKKLYTTLSNANSGSYQDRLNAKWPSAQEGEESDRRSGDFVNGSKDLTLLTATHVQEAMAEHAAQRTKAHAVKKNLNKRKEPSLVVLSSEPLVATEKRFKKSSSALPEGEVLSSSPASTFRPSPSTSSSPDFDPFPLSDDDDIPGLQGSDDDDDDFDVNAETTRAFGQLVANAKEWKGGISQKRTRFLTSMIESDSVPQDILNAFLSLSKNQCI